MGKEGKRGRYGPSQIPEVVTPTVASTSAEAPAPVPVVPASVPPATASAMSWPLAVAVIATLAFGFTFAYLMIAVVEMAYWAATAITVLLVAAIVSALIPRPGDGGVWRRIANAIHALGGDGSGGPGGAQ